VKAFLSKLDSLDEDRIISVGSVLSAVVALGALLYLYTLAVDFGDTPSIFPVIVIRIGIAIAALLVLKELITQFVKPGIFERDDESKKHLTGEKSQFSASTRLSRLVIIGATIVAFFVLSNVNVLVAILVCYPASVYLLGVRDIKQILLGTAVVLTFVYLVFIVLIQMPLDLF